VKDTSDKVEVLDVEEIMERQKERNSKPYEFQKSINEELLKKK